MISGMSNIVGAESRVVLRPRGREEAMTLSSLIQTLCNPKVLQLDGLSRASERDEGDYYHYNHTII